MAINQVLQGILNQPYQPSFVPLIEILGRLDLKTSLQLCLDAGDVNSAPVSPTSWLDTSGNGYDFFLGDTVAGEATDPAFNGSVGGRSYQEYWSFDGGDYFRYKAANETWMDSLHKANAKFSVFCWIYLPSLGVTSSVFGDAVASATSVGVRVNVRTVDTVRFALVNSVSSVPHDTSGTVKAGWNFIAVTMDDANSNLIMQVNSTQEIFIYTYASPSSATATATLELAALGAGSTPIPNLSRMGVFAAWSGVALDPLQLNKIYMATRLRFGV